MNKRERKERDEIKNNYVGDKKRNKSKKNNEREKNNKGV